MKFTIELQQSGKYWFGWQWRVLLPKDESEELQQQLSGYTTTRSGAVREAHRAAKYYVVVNAYPVLWSMPERIEIDL